MKRRLHMFLDETGQDTRGRLFLVAAVVIASDRLDATRVKVRSLELRSKKTHKWSRSSRARRAAFLEALDGGMDFTEGVFWRSFGQGLDYVGWVAEMVAAAAGQVAPYDALTVVLDGGNWSEQERVKAALRSRNLPWRKVSEGRDEGDPLLRLTDSLAGYLRDRQEASVPAYPGLDSKLISL